MASKYIVFENPGEIDIRAITTFGVSVKENDNPIGYFGTGLKYAISIIMRNDCTISIYSGEMKLIFSIKETEVRGKKFQVLAMNNADMPFTTELGKNWQMWQAFREVYCNALDEGGDVYSCDEIPLPEKMKTKVIVSGDLFYDEYLNRDQIVIRPTIDPIVENKIGKIYDLPSSHIYYRGVRVANIGKSAMFTYNITTDLDLTEDRSVMYRWDAFEKISMMACKIDSMEMAAKVLNSDESHYESQIMVGSEWSKDFFSKEFIEVIERDYEINKDTLNKSAINWLIKQRKGASLKFYKDAKLTKIEEAQLSKCVGICNEMYEGFDKYSIKVVVTLGENTMALADDVSNTIVISKRCFTLGTKYLFSTILEEYYHLSTGYNDLTRSLQTYLFDTIATLVENYVVQEPI